MQARLWRTPDKKVGMAYFNKILRNSITKEYVKMMNMCSMFIASYNCFSYD